MKGLGLVLAAMMVTGNISETAAMPPHWATQCVKGWKQYKQKPGHKAFAMSSERYTHYYCGFAWSARSVAQAKVQAIKICTQSKGKMANCHVIAAQ
jgi:hypothetical protein